MRLIIDNVSKIYRDKRGQQTPVLQQIDLQVEKEEFLAIVGPSGCGKSTLLGMVAGLVPASSGRIVFSPEEQETVREPRIGVVFQEHALFPWRTVQHNVEFGLEMLGLKKTERRDRATMLIQMVGLSGFERRYPHQLSGGMRQRVGIARALAIEPDLLLMDEPLSALDAQVRLLLQEELMRIWELRRQKTLYVTHNIAEAVAMADRIVVLSRRPGRVRSIIAIDIPRAHRQDAALQTQIAEYHGLIWDLIRSDAEQALYEDVGR